MAEILPIRRKLYPSNQSINQSINQTGFSYDILHLQGNTQKTLIKQAWNRTDFPFALYIWIDQWGIKCNPYLMEKKTAWRGDRIPNFQSQETHHSSNSIRPIYAHMYCWLPAEVKVAFDNNHLQRRNRKSIDDIHRWSDTNIHLIARTNFGNQELE